MKYKHLLSHIKMGKEILTFPDTEIQKENYHHKIHILSKDVHVGKLSVTNKISSGKKDYKYFIGYLYNDHKVKPLYIMLPNTSVYLKS